MTTYEPDTSLDDIDPRTDAALQAYWRDVAEKATAKERALINDLMGGDITDLAAHIQCLRPEDEAGHRVANYFIGAVVVSLNASRNLQ